MYIPPDNKGNNFMQLGNYRFNPNMAMDIAEKVLIAIIILIVTWALAKAANEANGLITHADLIARTGANLSNFAQHPQLECPDAQRERPLFAPLSG